MTRHAEALVCFDRVLELSPDFAEACCNRGNALLGLGRHQPALANFVRACELKPDFLEALCSQGEVLQVLGDAEAALVCYTEALRINPELASAYNGLGTAFQMLRRLDDARSCYQRALQIQHDYAEAHHNLGTLWQELKDPGAAIGCYGKALQIKPGYVNAIRSLGAALQQLKRYADAASCYRAVLDLAPADRHALGMLANCALNSCDWPSMARYTPMLQAGIASGTAVIMPFTLLGFPVSPAAQLACTKAYVRDTLRVFPPPMWQGEQYAHQRLRVAYLSADFHQHPTACLMAELFELHDHRRFEIIGLSFGPDDQSAIRARLIGAFDQFHDVRTLTDMQVAVLMRDMEVDIAVDLKGHTQDARFGILAHRPAPIQVSYLGYPGSMGAEFIDYLIGDKYVLPFDQHENFSEKIVHLPDSYQVNDATRRTSPDGVSKAACGLPDSGFVFCCFNNNYKITLPVFSVWMRLLLAVEGSVLWLLEDTGLARKNLVQAAVAAGVNPERLVFADRVTVDQHLSRHRLADLFLDTLPINAHTTASDALWAGLPLVTCVGESFAGRVAGSLLHAVGLPELVTTSLDDYEALALRLATHPAQLLAVRRALEKNRATCALFDTDRFRRHLEAAYETMWRQRRHGPFPVPFAVP